MIVEARLSAPATVRWEGPKVTNTCVGMVQLKEEQVKLEGGELSECEEAERIEMQSLNEGDGVIELLQNEPFGGKRTWIRCR